MTKTKAKENAKEKTKQKNKIILNIYKIYIRKRKKWQKRKMQMN